LPSHINLALPVFYLARRSVKEGKTWVQSSGRLQVKDPLMTNKWRIKYLAIRIIKLVYH